MQTNGKDIYINIKELPLINSVQAGDFFIVETTQGTNIIDFSNILIPPENTTFYNEIEQLQTDVSALSTLAALQRALLISVSGILDTKIDRVSGELVTLIDQVSANLNDKLYLIAGGGVFANPVDAGTTVDGVRCQFIRNDTGDYTFTFNGPVFGASVSSDADFTYLEEVDPILGVIKVSTYNLSYSFDISGGSTAFAPITAIDTILEKVPVDPLSYISIIAF